MKLLEKIKRPVVFNQTAIRKNASIDEYGEVINPFDKAAEIALVNNISILDAYDTYVEPINTSPYTPPILGSNQDNQNERQSINLKIRSAASVSNEYQRDLILRMLHRFLMRGMDIDLIAKLFDVSVSTVNR